MFEIHCLKSLASITFCSLALPYLRCSSLVVSPLSSRAVNFAEFSLCVWLLSGPALLQSLLTCSHRSFSCLSSDRHPINQTSNICHLSDYPFPHPKQGLDHSRHHSISVLFSPHYRRWSSLFCVSLFIISPSPRPRGEPFEGRDTG